MGIASSPCSVNTRLEIKLSPLLHNENEMCLLCDKRLNGIEDKFINSILHNTSSKNGHITSGSPILNNGKSSLTLHSASFHIVKRLCQMWLMWFHQ